MACCFYNHANLRLSICLFSARVLDETSVCAAPAQMLTLQRLLIQCHLLLKAERVFSVDEPSSSILLLTVCMS
jgi:hypothetical protein